RRTLVGSACGLCGRATIESLQVVAPFLAPAWRVPRALAASLPDRLRRAQPGFTATGGLHAAGLFARDGGLVAAAEDVGRHNAVDKVIGRLLLAGARRRAPHAGDLLLAVSGRASFEIVQKAWLAGVPFVAAVSAPSTLAVDLAVAAGLTLLGFVRDGAFNVYAHPERLEP
ncbi:MAG TPA: formate dehydrogenase accessory sulfurtransferase FdhD, partial [Vicinamibacterales bacterium]|nr:formate dehydrogenase accessory sulfurtransferase FdhD [Vicinamibacterales bacterium]